MPTNAATPSAPATIVAAGASPVTLTIEPTSEPVTLRLTSASAITVTGQTALRSVDIQHTP